MSSAETTTKKVLIIRKYIELTTLLKQHIVADLFPPVDEIDPVDLIIFINCFFETAADYRSGIRMLMSIKKIEVSDEVFEALYPAVESFLIWLRELK
jgi:hypothetical protein